MPTQMTLRKLLTVVVPTALLSITLYFWKRRKKAIENRETEIQAEATENANSDENTISSNNGGEIMIADTSIIDFKIACPSTEESSPVFQTFPKEVNSMDKSIINEEECCAVEVTNEQAASFTFSFERSDLDEQDSVPDIMNDIFELRKKRYRNQSSCDGDSAIVEDYSSDRSFSETDSSTKNPEEVLSILRESELENMISEEDETRSTDHMQEKDWCDYPCSTEYDERFESEESSSGKESILSPKKSQFLSNQTQAKSNSPRRKPKRKSKSKKRSLKIDSSSSPAKSALKSPKKKESSPQKNISRKSESNHRQTDQPWRESMVVVDPDDNTWQVIDYEFPDSKCGKLIGRSGKNVQEIKSKTGATICIEQEMFHGNRILSINGTKSQVRRAEKILLEKFESDMFKIREVTREIASTYMSTVPLDESSNVIVTAVENAAHFYIQMFKAEVDETLIQLQSDLDSVYAFPRHKYLFTEEDQPIVNEVCVGNIDNTWCRLKVQQIFPETYQAEVFFIDYGGTVVVPIQALLKIRSDFLDIPSQAVECYLSHVLPLPGQEIFSADSTSIFGQLIEGKVLQSTISSFSDKIPCLDLSYFDSSFQQVVSINKELANWGVVQWT